MAKSKVESVHVSEEAPRGAKSREEEFSDSSSHEETRAAVEEHVAVAKAHGLTMRDDSPDPAHPGQVMTINYPGGGETCGAGTRSGHGRCGGRVISDRCTVCGASYAAPHALGGTNVDLGITS